MAIDLGSSPTSWDVSPGIYPLYLGSMGFDPVKDGFSVPSGCVTKRGEYTEIAISLILTSNKHDQHWDGMGYRATAFFRWTDMVPSKLYVVLDSHRQLSIYPSLTLAIPAWLSVSGAALATPRGQGWSKWSAHGGSVHMRSPNTKNYGKSPFFMGNSTITGHFQ
jgi:hypothetical protein